MSSPIPPHLETAGDARSTVIKMAVAGALLVATIGGLIAYGALADRPPERSALGAQAVAGGVAAPSGPASLWVDVLQSDAYVLVDGDSVGLAPLWLDSVAVGERSVRVIGPDRSVVIDTTVLAAAGSTINLETTSGSGPGTPETEPFASGGPAPLPAPPPSDARPVTATGDLRVTSSPAGATVILNGRRVGTTPWAGGGLVAGTYTVGVSRSGYQTAARRVEVRPGGVSESTVNLLPTAPPPPAPVAEAAPPATGTVEIVVRPWGQIDIDGTVHQRETDVVYRTELTAGPHQIRVSHPQLGSAERTVTVRSGERERVEFDLTVD